MIKCENECPKGNGNICCHGCENYDSCNDGCDEMPADCGYSTKEQEETAPVPFESKHAALIVEIKNLYATKAKIETQEKTLKEKLKTAMEEFAIKKFEKNNLTLTYIATTTATSVDSKKLKENYPDIFVECSKTSNKSAYVKVTVK